VDGLARVLVLGAVVEGLLVGLLVVVALRYNKRAAKSRQFVDCMSECAERYAFGTPEFNERVQKCIVSKGASLKAGG
jgi:hypothetical protein